MDADLDWFRTTFSGVVDNVEQVIRGKRETIELLTL
ncbi:MAG: ATPase, partial [Acidimicrobiia bacterium]|nr:ATPase [Acidimicrobiia bacterium]